MAMRLVNERGVVAIVETLTPCGICGLIVGLVGDGVLNRWNVPVSALVIASERHVEATGLRRKVSRRRMRGRQWSARQATGQLLPVAGITLRSQKK
jgi:hypothetical protein